MAHDGQPHEGFDPGSHVPWFREGGWTSLDAGPEALQPAVAHGHLQLPASRD